MTSNHQGQNVRLSDTTGWATGRQARSWARGQHLLGQLFESGGVAAIKRPQTGAPWKIPPCGDSTAARDQLRTTMVNNPKRLGPQRLPLVTAVPHHAPLLAVLPPTTCSSGPHRFLTRRHPEEGDVRRALRYVGGVFVASALAWTRRGTGFKHG